MKQVLILTIITMPVLIIMLLCYAAMLYAAARHSIGRGTVLYGYCTALIYYFGPIGEPYCHVFAPLRHGSARSVARGGQAAWWWVTGLL
jgi:hypothetical protein